ncbi:MAG: hypothetical protein IJV56_05635 [Neisseriaceae bacterium]|nr:hypothetical protein [Neisseriaceae bacterium]
MSFGSFRCYHRLSGCLKAFLYCRCINFRYPKKSCGFFRRLPRLNFVKARNDDIS